jgi:Trk-type K+ transport system membrane component
VVAAGLDYRSSLEYVAMGKIIKNALTFILMNYSIAIIALTTYIQTSTTARATMLANGVSNPIWWSLFHTVSAFNNAGFSLFAENLVPYADAPFVLWVLSWLICVGNTLFPVCLRLFIRLRAWLTSRSKGVYQYVLDRPRLIYTHLFPQHETQLLFSAWLGFTVFSMSLYWLLDRSNPCVVGHSLAARLAISFFTAVNTRAAGMNAVDVSCLHLGLPTLYILLMIVAPYPFIFTLRATIHDDENDFGAKIDEDGTDGLIDDSESESSHSGPGGSKSTPRGSRRPTITGDGEGTSRADRDDGRRAVAISSSESSASLSSDEVAGLKRDRHLLSQPDLPERVRRRAERRVRALDAKAARRRERERLDALEERRQAREAAKLVARLKASAGDAIVLGDDGDVAPVLARVGRGNANVETLTKRIGLTMRRSLRALAHAYRQETLQRDLMLLWLGWFVITCVEGTVMADDTAVNPYTAMFEVASGYGNVGLTLGYPGTTLSYIGTAHTTSKIVMALVCLLGRHRGLPLAVDRAVDFTKFSWVQVPPRSKTSTDPSDVHFAHGIAETWRLII